MKKVLIIPSNTDLNRGDQALVWESIRLVEDVYGKDNVHCNLMSGLEGNNAYLQNRQTAELGYSFVAPLLKHPGRNFSTRKEDSTGYSKLTILRWGFQALTDYLHTFLLLSGRRAIRLLGEKLLSKDEKQTLDAIKGCDAVFVKGGGFIHSYGAITDSYFIYFLTFHIRVAEAYGKKVFLLPNSIGPLKNKVAKRIALKALKNCSLVTVRENISKDFLERQNVKAEYYPDLGFYLKPTNKDMSGYLVEQHIPLKQKKVVITLRPYRFTGCKNHEQMYHNYIHGFIMLVENLVTKGYHITFMAHTLGPSSHEDDRIAIKEVIQNLPERIRKCTSYIEDYNLNCKDVEKIYSYFDYMIGTRFHSIIFSLNMSVPSIAIAYGGNKGKGIMKVLDLGHNSIDIGRINDSNLIEIFNELESRRDSFLANLAEKRIAIDNQRELLIKRIQSIM